MAEILHFEILRKHGQTHKQTDRHGHYNTSPSPYGGRGNYDNDYTDVYYMNSDNYDNDYTDEYYADNCTDEYDAMNDMFDQCATISDIFTCMQNDEY